jgi:hypothetical protein
MAWTNQRYGRVFKALDAANIDFALHWGQQNDFSAERVRMSYGDMRVSSWKRARARVLDTQELRDRFSNPMLEKCGLS